MPSIQRLVTPLASAIDALRHVWGIGCTCSTAPIEGPQLHSCLKAESMPIMRCADMRGVLRRRAYQRAVSVPTPALEQLWASYERFEQSGSNKALGRQASLLVDLLISLVKDVQGRGGACTHLDIVCSSEHGFLYTDTPSKVVWDANCCRTGLLHPLQPRCLCLKLMHDAAGRFWMSRGPSTTWRARCSGSAASSCRPSPRRRWPSRQVGITFCHDTSH